MLHFPQFIHLVLIHKNLFSDYRFVQHREIMQMFKNLLLELTGCKTYCCYLTYGV